MTKVKMREMIISVFEQYKDLLELSRIPRITLYRWIENQSTHEKIKASYGFITNKLLLNLVIANSTYSKQSSEWWDNMLMHSSTSEVRTLMGELKDVRECWQRRPNTRLR